MINVTLHDLQEQVFQKSEDLVRQGEKNITVFNLKQGHRKSTAISRHLSGDAYGFEYVGQYPISIASLEFNHDGQMQIFCIVDYKTKPYCVSIHHHHHVWNLYHLLAFIHLLSFISFTRSSS